MSTTPELWLVIPLLAGNPKETPDTALNTLRKNYFDGPSPATLKALLDFAHISVACQGTLSADLESNTTLVDTIRKLRQSNMLLQDAGYPTAGCGQDLQFLNLTARNIKI